MQKQIVIDNISLDEFTVLLNQAVSSAVEKLIKPNNYTEATGSYSINEVSLILKKAGAKTFGYKFIKSRLADGTFQYDEKNRVKAYSVENYINKAILKP